VKIDREKPHNGIIYDPRLHYRPEGQVVDSLITVPERIQRFFS